MMNPDLRVIPVHLVVSDPWEFVSAVGSGPFAGQIVATEGAGQVERALIRLDRPLDYAGNVVEYLIATPRHTNQTLDRLSDATVHVNAQWLQGSSEDWAVRAGNWRGGLALVADLRKSKRG